MKILCVEVKDGTPQFYSKCETAQIRNNEPLYIPFFCKALRCEFAFAIKINRVTKAISEKFAGRCWNEYSVVTNFWSEDLAAQQRALCAPLDIAYIFDRSFALENDFHVMEELSDTISASAFINEEMVQRLDWNDVRGEVNKVIAYISSYVTLKIGDVIMIRSSNQNRIVSIGDRIEIKFGDETILETIIK
ncbi:MAG: fumarylacetoacetate hydrolase family protein [Rikenellaceae bacterium]